MLLNRLDKINVIRIENGEWLAKRLQELDGIIVPKVIDGAKAVYLRLPIVVKDKEIREKLYIELSRRGIGVSKMYRRS